MAEAWWRRAILYRIDPSRFQDSDGDGIGDLPGVTERLDYIESLGVDALVLDGRYDPRGLDDLIAEGSRHRLRVLLTVTPEMQAGSRDALLTAVHGWLAAGAAGVSVSPPSPESASASAGYASLEAALRTLLQSFPGERVLLAEATPHPFVPTPAFARVHGRRRGGPPAAVSLPAAKLLLMPGLPVQADASALRRGLAVIAGDSSGSETPLLRFANDPGTGEPNAAAYAAALLASRGAALFDAGDEIGLDLNPTAGMASAALPVMQWTPANVQSAPASAEGPAQAAVSPDGVTAFGSYHPYVPPPRNLSWPSAAPPKVAVDRNIPLPLPGPDTLPGYTRGALPNAPMEGKTINVITEDRDPRSLLNAYRQLIGLHHGYPTLRNGTQNVLDYLQDHVQDRVETKTLVWVRRAPAGSHTAGNVVVAANLGDAPVTLSLDGELERLGVRPGILRLLMTASTQPLTGETTEALTLPPHAVYLGEIFHGSVLREAPVRRSSRSRHRVRR